jgi:fatty-acyl-CoA synthase
MPGRRPDDEWDAISLNYTSGTTGNPKGVVYHHRGAYLNSMSNIVSWGMPPHSATYLWTLPMFHCNGWCFVPWTMAANAGTNVCLRRVDPKLIFDAIREHGSPTTAARRSCIQPDGQRSRPPCVRASRTRLPA